MEHSRISHAAVVPEPAILQDTGSVALPRPRFDWLGVIAPSLLAILLLVSYLPMLFMTGRVIIYGDEMAHGLFAPLIALYIVWEKRACLLKPSGATSPWSLVFLSFAACVSVVATLANSSTLSRFAMLFSLAGCLLLVGGWITLRQFVFPLALLLFTFPIPAVLYGDLTQPLQLLATRLSESALELLGFSVIREGNILQLVHMRLSVVEACSGLRSLITLFFFCLVYAYLFESRLWLRTVIALSAIPVAVAVNVLRITATGVLGKFDMAWTSGTRHEILGWTAFALGFLLVFLFHVTVRRIITHRKAGAVV
ncbi:MAG: exosortase/archaeosortase family protein [Bryobacteraceae bacterium]|jgi:exosortase